MYMQANQWLITQLNFYCEILNVDYLPERDGTVNLRHKNSKWDYQFEMERVPFLFKIE